MSSMDKPGEVVIPSEPANSDRHDFMGEIIAYYRPRASSFWAESAHGKFETEVVLDEILPSSTDDSGRYNSPVAVSKLLSRHGIP